MDLTQLNARLEEIRNETRTMADLIAKENREFTDEEQKRFDGLFDEAGKIEKKIETEERVAKLEAKRTADNLRSSTLGAGNAPRVQTQSRTAEPDAEETRALVLNAWMVRNNPRPRSLTAREVEACSRSGVNPNEELVFELRSAYDLRAMRREGWDGGYGRSYMGAERRALSAEFGATGGFATVPESMRAAIEVNMLHYGSILQACDIIRTPTGESMTWPTVDDTSNTGYQIGENVQVTSTAQPSFGSVRLDVYDYSSGAVLVPYRLTRDTPFDLASLVGSLLGERLGRIQNTKGTTGTGSATPYGIVNRAAAGVTTASSTAIAWDEVTDLIHSIDVAYRPGSAFMFHDNTYKALRKLKDGMGRPLWADGPNSTPPADLQGYPYFINNDMASSIATGAITMIFGQLKAHKIRQVNQVRLKRLEERYADYDQTGFMAFMSFGSNLVSAGTAPVKKLAQL